MQPRERVLLDEDGVVVDLQAGVARIVGAVPCGYIYVDGSSVGGTDEALLKDRRILRDEGFITCIVVMDAATGKIAAGPEIEGAVGDYVQAVKDGSFPGPEHCY